MKSLIPALLGINAGYIDTAGYLALHGLFASHVTGNFVTLGVSFVEGSSGAYVKLLALPTFCLVVMVVRLASNWMRRVEIAVVRPLLALKVVLLGGAAALIVAYGPFADADRAIPIAAGMMLVSAMAIQNAVQRVHMASLPPTTIMTGNSTQLMLDVADFLWARGTAGERQVVHARLVNLARAVAAFAAGCALAALVVSQFGDWCFALPPFIAAITVWQRLDGMAR